jgi:hypothetical protein
MIAVRIARQPRSVLLRELESFYRLLDSVREIFG